AVRLRRAPGADPCAPAPAARHRGPGPREGHRRARSGDEERLERRPSAGPDGDGVPDPRTAHAPLASGRRPEGDRRARLGGRDGSARLERDRRPAESPAREAAERRHPDRHGPWCRVPPGGSVTAARPHDVRRLSIRVALAATALVAAAYVVVAVAVVAIVTGNLTGQIDARLVDTVSRAHEGLPGSGHYLPPPGARPGGLPFLIWTIQPDGDVITDDAIPDLPVAYRSVTAPTDATIGGVQMRIAGARQGGSYVVAAQTLDTVSQSQSTIVLAELLIGPVLLAIVFLGAVAIGRRVATPVEIARRRQLEFTADASHELRTPLSVIEANTSLALAQDRSEEWYRTAFGRVDVESKRMRLSSTTSSGSLGSTRPRRRRTPSRSTSASSRRRP